MSFKNKKKHKNRNFAGFEKLHKLHEAEFLIEGGQLGEALEFLNDATHKFPSEAAFWEMLADVGSQLKNASAMQRACGKLVRLQPEYPDWLFGLAYAYGLDDRLALSYRGFRRFLEKFPGDEKSAQAAELLGMAEPELLSTLAMYKFPDGDLGIDLLCLHDETQVLLQQQRPEEARGKAEKLIAAMPDFVPAYNNLSLILFIEGEAGKAVAAARKALERQPDYYHALSNLARFSVFLGRQDEAEQFANRLRAVDSADPDTWIKKIEAFTYIGNDQAVADVYREANAKPGFAVLDNFGKHLAAFAFYRLGKKKEARNLWREILKSDPDFDLARQNLEEIYLPEKDRNVFGLPLNYWLPTYFLAELIRETGKLKEGKHFEKNLRKKISLFFAKNPNILNVLATLLDRSDETAREFAIKLMDLAGTPESYAALKEFAFGQTGSDDMRYKAAMALCKADVISNNIRLWREGEWREMRMLNFEISYEPVEAYPLKPKAEQMLAKGYYAMQNENLELAEQYYKMALEAHGGDHPSILFNMLAIDQMRGKDANRESALHKLVDAYPDYTFGSISLALLEVQKGNIEAAKNLTDKFYEKKQWHFTEITGWFHLNIELALAEKQFDTARMYLGMLKKIDDNPAFDDWGMVITKREIAHKLLSIPSKLTGRKKKK